MRILILVVSAFLSIVNTQSATRLQTDSCAWNFDDDTKSYQYSCDDVLKTGSLLEEESSQGAYLPTRKTKKNVKDKLKKHTGVNFILYNSGVKFNQKDNSENELNKLKLDVNCVLFVVKDNQCYGWGQNKKSTTTAKPKPGDDTPSSESEETVVRPAINWGMNDGPEQQSSDTDDSSQEPEKGPAKKSLEKTSDSKEEDRLSGISSSEEEEETEEEKEKPPKLIWQVKGSFSVKKSQDAQSK